MDWFLYLSLAGFSASPVGEELLAIPAGILMGLNPGVVLILCVVANFLPIPILLYLMKKAQEIPTLQQWLEKKKSEKVKDWLDRYGVWGLILLTPWLGVYAITITCELLGMNRFRSTFAQGISLVIYGFLALGAALAGVEGFHWLTKS